MYSQPKELFIFGAGSFMRCIKHMIERTCQVMGLRYWIVDKFNSTQSNHVISEAEFKQRIGSSFYFNVPVADVGIRSRIVADCISLGGIPISIISDDFIRYDDVVISDGAIICAGNIATTSINVGRFFHSNIYSYVEHDCVIGDFVTFSPRVSCNGYVHICDQVFVGAGAIIRNGSSEKPLIIGEGAIIGMGAVVTKSVPAFSTVVGNPARIMSKNDK